MLCPVAVRREAHHLYVMVFAESVNFMTGVISAII
jgi:hypothetical protein